MMTLPRFNVRLFCYAVVFLLSHSLNLWAQPLPPLIPLTTDPADESGIEDLSYNSDGTGYVILDSGQGLSKAEISGQRWTFRVPWEDREQGLKALDLWLEQKGVVVTAREGNTLFARMPTDPARELFFLINPGEDGVQCDIVEKVTLSFDTPIHISVSPEYPSMVFYTEHSGKTQDRLDIDGRQFVPENEDDHLELDVKADLKIVVGKLERAINFSAYRNTREETYWEVSDMPQFPGTYRWTFTLRAGDNPPEFKLMLKKGGPIPGLTPGDSLGGLLVKNVPYGSATAVPEYEDQNTFPGFSETNRVGDVTPTGEALFWLPPGMWCVQVSPLDLSSGTSLLKSHFIPVQPGKMTLVDWPRSLNQAFSGKTGGKMKILSAKADAEKAMVDISLMGTERTAVAPTVKTLEITEGGQRVTPISCERIKTPADVVLLLDSSGSMRAKMGEALEATRNFIKGLDKTTRIRVIDFDTRPNLLKGESSAQVLAALKSVKANGATALYDSILEGLNLLNGSDRPSLLVFTDGVDANHDDTGPGSQATQEEVLTAVSEAGIPVFTIGFGEKSDVNTLTRVAEMSGGEYYLAQDSEQLEGVFRKINSNLGSQFRVTYARPRENNVSDRPVISLMVDNSGSMDSWPDECGGCDKRMEKTRQLLRKFVEKLPGDFLIQVATFSGDVIVEQVLTDDRQAALRGISQMEGRNTTDILGSMTTALDTLASVPSTRRYLVYLADAALDVDDDEKAAFEAILGKIKDANISSLFIEMVEEEGADAFVSAAEKTGGKSLVTKDFNRLDQTFSTLAEEMRGAARPSTTALLRVNLSHRSKAGENILFSAARQVAFPQKQRTDKISTPEQVTVRPGPSLTPYDSDVARLISGTDVMMKDVRVIKRLPLDIEERNKAVSVHLDEAISLSRFKGIDAPDHLRFFALTLAFENILPSQRVAVYPDGSNHPAAWVTGEGKPLRYEDRVPTYLIPDIRRHIFLRWNNSRSYPVSEVTWLASEPLTLPGDDALAVEPKKKIRGTLMFMVPSGHMKQASLHLYDTNYGHIDIPISGVLKQTKDQIEALPKKPPAKLSDAFGFSVTGVETLEKIGITETGEDTSFVVVDGRFTSNMQAHLNLDPRKRFSLKLPTGRGSLFLPVHPVTAQLPLGFFRPVLVTPGADTPVRMVFNVPSELIDALNQASVLIDIYGGSVEAPLYVEGSEDSGTSGLESTTGKEVSGKGLALKIINSGPLAQDRDVGFGAHLLAVEVTLKDIKDSHHTQIGELVILKNKNFDPEKAAQTEAELDRLRMEAATLPNRGLANFGKTTLSVVPGMLQAVVCHTQLIGGLDEESIVPDGQVLNGVFLFSLPGETALSDWEISSLVIPGLAVSPGTEPYDNRALFAKRLVVENEMTSSFQEAVEERLAQVIAAREQTGFEKQGHMKVGAVTPGLSSDPGRRIPPPALTVGGAVSFQEVDSLDRLKTLVSGLRVLPSGAYAPWVAQYRPAAVLSQGWGTENDLALMLEDVVSRMGFASVRTSVALTDEGRARMAKRSGLEHCDAGELPAVRYVDHEGRNHMVVSPFMEEAGALAGLIVQTPGKVIDALEPETAGLTITLLMRFIGKPGQKALADISDALGGGDGEALYRQQVFSDSVSLLDLSQDALDIGYTKIPKEGGLAWQAVVDTPLGRLRSIKENCVSTADFKVVGEIISVQLPDNTYTRTRMLPKGTEISGRFHTLGINLPDMEEAPAGQLTRTARQIQEESHGQPDALSALKWRLRRVLSRFISAQTAHEKKLAGELGLVVGRTRAYRCIMVTAEKPEDGGALTLSMDLMAPHNQIHRAGEDRARRAFYIMAGMAGAEFEAQALGDKGIGLYSIWQGLPRETPLVFVDETNRAPFITQLEEKGYPASMAAYFRDLNYNKIVVFPSRGAMVNNRERWAWLEFDKETYQVVSVLDTGENGAMVENVIGNPVEAAEQYMVGALVGIDVSVWSVAAYSLELDDYNKIIKAAETFAKNMANNFGVGVKLGDLSIGVDVGGTPAASYGRGPKAEISPFDGKVTNNIGGFGNGYNDAVAYYFSQASNR